MASPLTPGKLALITALVAMGVASMALYVPSLPAIQQDFSVAANETQLTLTLFFLGFSGAQLIFGPLSDRFGRRPVLLIGLVIYGIISLACAFAWGIEALQTGRFLQGFVACIGPVVGRAVVRDMVDGASAAGAFAVLGMALALVPALAPVLGGLIQMHIGWRANFILLAVFAACLFILCLFKLRESNAETLPDALSPGRLVRIYAHLLRSPYFMGHVIVSGLAFAGFFAYFTQAPFLFIGELGIEADTFGYLMIFTVMGYATGSAMSGRLVPRIGTRTSILIGCGFCLAGAFLLLAFSAELTLTRAIAPMCIYTIGFGMVIPGSMAEALRPFPRVAGSASAVLGFVQFLCAALTSLIAQYVYDGTTFLLALAILAVAITAITQFLILTRKGPSAE